MATSYYKDIYNLLCKRHPNSKIYVISDHHFYHDNIISYERSEFQSIIEMNEYIINRHNNIISNDDIAIFLGDFCFKKSKIKDILNRMNGHKYLLFGNHDMDSLINCYGSLGFEGIFTTPVKINENFLSHYPLEGISDDFHFRLLVKEFNRSSGINYHGHIHGRNKETSSFVNVCCEVLDYEPLLIGYTEKVTNKELPLIINEDIFDEVLEDLKSKDMNINLIISDYIYTFLLESINDYHNNCFIYGSYPLYKKYGFISYFTDLDVCLINDDNVSNSKNRLLLKEICDKAFIEAKKFDNVDLKMYKRISNICIFNLLYANKLGNKYSGYYDMNLVPINIYRDTDFVKVLGHSTLEDILKKQTEFRFPKYEANFLSASGYIANMCLSLLFQKNSNSKKLVLSKLRHICRLYEINVPFLEDTFIRFFIRNIMFFYMTRRHDDIQYIKECKNVSAFLEQIPLTLKYQMEEILKNPQSLFNNVYDTFYKINFEEIPIMSKQLIKDIK